MPSPRNASTFSSFTTICSGVCFENVLMVIHYARPHTARTTQNNPLATNGPKNPDPSRCNTHLSGVTPLSDKPNHLQGFNHTRGTTPVTWRCTSYVALHPIRTGAMPTDRVHRPHQQAQPRIRTPPHGQALHHWACAHVVEGLFIRLWSRPRCRWAVVAPHHRCGGHRKELPRCRWAAAGPGRASRSTTPSEARVWRSRGRAAAHRHAQRPGPTR